MSKESLFIISFDSQHIKESQTLLKIQRPHFHHIVLEMWQLLSSKMYVLVISDILWPSVNKLIADPKYSFRKSDNLPKPIQKQLSQRQNFFFLFFGLIFEIYIKFWTFLKRKHDPYILCISEIRGCERRG